ncbi:MULTISPECIES: SusC/RagA family TonB-linked outer membrane protein [Sphingobacterium]|uniref:TonB-dependent receptor n=1 Tax=Sphingobacterium litopenaei TaxID=2763500 RepID=A0ABR7YCV1_9SPHI|nr:MULTISPECIES: TonB-dependent receptor [Sphingobacterium]MBD1429134.1 TonB-dependent receptor [Sphingobacterium litopenaei]NGM73239.1 TonB-dependent receptor [Sphingobacterium sp. SGL-16]
MNGLRLIFITIILSVVSTLDSIAQDITVRGVVRDSTGGIPSVSIRVRGTKVVTLSSDGFGRFEFSTNKQAQVDFQSVGFKSTTINLANQSIKSNNEILLDIFLEKIESEIEEVTVTGFGGTQKKASLVSAITTVNVKELKTASSNLTNALAGRVAGMIAFQSSGEPGLGTDNSTFYIRGLSTFGTGKQDPLILIDGVESSPTDMARLQPDDISDFSVLKDAAAASVYGARGANGVILINTKMGMDGAPKFNFRVENRISSNTKNFEFADNITYMRMANEAALTRTPNGIEPYSQNKIFSTIDGEDPYLFPSNNWLSMLIKDYTNNQGYNLNISGGTTRGRYYIAGTFNRDNGVLKVEPLNNFNSNIKLNNYSLRVNVDFNVTKTTTAIVRMYGQFDDYIGPMGGGAATFDNALNANPVMFPSIYPAEKLPFIEHPLFGSSQTRNTDLSLSSTMYMNPYAEMVRGYQTYKTSNMQPQIEIKQDLNGITEGLSLRGMGYLRRYAFMSASRSYQPFFYEAIVNSQDGTYNLKALNDGSATALQPTGTEYLSYAPPIRDVDSRIWLEGTLNYSRTFSEKHAVSGMLVSYISSYESAIGNNVGLVETLPSRNAGISGRFTYGFKDRYLAEFNFGYNGSERFDANHRWGFFPSFGFGYRLSEEPFFEPIRSVISNFKLRGTYGLVGNDAIGSNADRFFYLSNVNLNNGNYGSTFGRDDGAPRYNRPGVSISRYANPNITWELSKQLNLGLDMSIGRGIDIIVDAFSQKRSNILQPVSGIDNASGLMATPWSNYGRVNTKGVDLSVNYRKNFSQNFWMDARGTFTYATSEIVKVDELPYSGNLSHLTRKGYSINQAWGYIAERLFIDNQEVANSPVQFGDIGLLAGDIKYRDITKDGLVNGDDMVPIGYPTEPEVLFGFGSSFGYKNFDLGFFFQGATQYSFFINSNQIQPFYSNGGRQTGLLKVIADDYWSETNQNSYAFWPRLSTWRVGPNNQTSTWWMRNGGFLRLKSVDIGYNIKSLERFKINNARVYLSGSNLFLLSNFKLWDVEMRGNGLGYPLQSVYNVGIQINL